MTRAQLLTLINNYIYENTNWEITATRMKEILDEIVNAALLQYEQLNLNEDHFFVGNEFEKAAILSKQDVRNILVNLGTKEVDETALADGYIPAYNSSLDKYELVNISSVGDKWKDTDVEMVETLLIDGYTGEGASSISPTLYIAAEIELLEDTDIGKVSLRLFGSSPDTATVEIRQDNFGSPNGGTVVATSTVDVSGFFTGSEYEDIDFPINGTLPIGNYWIVAYSSTTLSIQIHYGEPGAQKDNGVWSLVDARPKYRVYGIPTEAISALEPVDETRMVRVNNEIRYKYISDMGDKDISITHKKYVDDAISSIGGDVKWQNFDVGGTDEVNIDKYTGVSGTGIGITLYRAGKLELVELTNISAVEVHVGTTTSVIPDTLTVELRADNLGTPDNTVIATNTVDVSYLTSTKEDVKVPFSTTLSTGIYWIVVYSSANLSITIDQNAIGEGGSFANDTWTMGDVRPNYKVYSPLTLGYNGIEPIDTGRIVRVSNNIEYNEISDMGGNDTSVTHKKYVDDAISSIGGGHDQNTDTQIINGANVVKTTTTGVEITGDTLFDDNVTITGNLTVNGTEVIQNVETLEIEDNLLLINKGETGAGVTAGEAGIEIDRGTADNYHFKFIEADQSFKIGEPSSLQKVATREDIPLNNGFAIWNATTNSFDTVLALPGQFITGTHGEIKTMFEGDGLVVGKKYVITDYKTRYTQPVTNEILEAANTETLVLTATSVNTFDVRVQSVEYPKDIIEYDITDATLEAPNGGITRKGKITYRLDNNQNETYYDHRTVLSNINTINYLTFDTGCINNKIGKSTVAGFVYNNIVFGINCENNIIGNDSHSNKIGDGSYGNKIGSRFKENIIGTGFIYNSIGEGCGDNTIADAFSNNQIGNGFKENTTLGSFTNNVIGNDFMDNPSIGNSFSGNQIGNGFSDNSSIGTSFNGNQIGNNFSANTSIGTNFQNNTIESEFYNNTIGDIFTNNVIGNEFQNNTIGNVFRLNNVIFLGLDSINFTAATHVYNNYNCEIYNDSVVGVRLKYIASDVIKFAAINE